MKWRRKRDLPEVRLDPYVGWAEATQWRGFRRMTGQRLGAGDPPVLSVRVLVQAKDAAAAREAMAWDWWSVAPIYKDSPVLALRHFVADLPLARLKRLKSVSPDTLRWELAMPLRDADTTARAQAIGAYGETRAATDFRPKEYFDVDAPRTEPGPIEGPVLAVIDFGCPFMNEAFLRADGTTRVTALWDQGARRVPPPKKDGRQSPWPWADATGRMGYGRVLRGPTMDKILRACRATDGDPQVLDEAEAYRRIDYLIDYDDARRRVWAATHGSHVLGVAGGRRDPASGPRAGADKASDAPLVFVQLPSLTAADSSGSSLSAQVLDAVHYVLDVCEREARVVIVLSYGSFAGPHDGSSLIEQALDEIVEERGKNLAIVLGAGNGRQAACHAERSVRVDRSALLRIHLDAGDYTDTFVETWFKPRERLLGRVRARVRTSHGDWSDWIGIGEEVCMHDVGDRRAVARLSFQRRAPNGARPLLLLALSPTARPADDDGPLAPAGSWQIEVMLQTGIGQDPADTEVLMDSWIERDDPGWLGQGAQPRFEEQRVGDEDQTLSSLATGRFTIAAGGFRLSDGAPAAYSSTGRRKGPDLVYAACEESADQPNICSAAVRSNDSLRMNGTSVAAPVLARRIYNHLATSREDVASTQWNAALGTIVDEEFKRAGDAQRDSVLRKPRPG